MLTATISFKDMGQPNLTIFNVETVISDKLGFVIFHQGENWTTVERSGILFYDVKQSEAPK